MKRHLRVTGKLRKSLLNFTPTFLCGYFRGEKKSLLVFMLIRYYRRKREEHHCTEGDW